MAAQKQPYMCRFPGQFKVSRGFSPQAAYTSAYKPAVPQVWIYSETPTDHYATCEGGRRHYFVLFNPTE